MNDQSNTCEFLRNLDGVEKVFWLLDQKHPSHFCIVGEVAGRTHIDTWREAFRSLGRKTSFAASQIRVGADGIPFICKGEPRAVPVDSVEGFSGNWETLVASELSSEFNVSVDPLVRAVILQRADSTTIVLTMHHSISDGSSATLFLRDVIRVASGEDVQRSDSTISLEDAVTRTGIQPASPVTGAQDPGLQPPAYRQAGQISPSVTASRLSASATAALRDRAKVERATVHGALCAAASLTFSAVLSDYPVKPPRIFSPISVRNRILIGTEQLGTYVSGITTREDRIGVDFWDSAREFSRKTAALNDPSALVAAVLGVRAVMAGAPTVQAATDIWAHVFGAEVCVTNLGSVDIPNKYGDLTLEGLWGPAVSLGIESEQTVGALTINGQLHLLHTTFVPSGRFLEEFITSLEASVRG